MNLSAIKALCAGGKRVNVLNGRDGSQWFSNGRGAWLVDAVEIRTEATVAALFNLTEKARDKAIIEIRDAEDPRVVWDGGADDEEMMEIGALYAFGRPYIGLIGTPGIMFVDGDLLKPLRDDYRRYYVRWKDGEPMIAVYDDLYECQALILPEKNTTAAQLRDFAAKLAGTPFEWPEDVPEGEDDAEGGSE